MFMLFFALLNWQFRSVCLVITVVINLCMSDSYLKSEYSSPLSPVNTVLFTFANNAAIPSSSHDPVQASQSLQEDLSLLEP